MRFALGDDPVGQVKKRFLGHSRIYRIVHVVYQLADRHRRIWMQLLIVLKAIEQFRQPKTEAVVPKKEVS